MKISDYFSPGELKRLLSTLVVFLVILTVFGLFGFIVVPGLRNANRPPVAPPVEGTALETGWLDPTKYPPARGYDIQPLDPKTVLTPTPELIQRGWELYVKNCAQCHGQEGRGDGPSSAGLVPPPRNFTSSEGWKNGSDRPGIYKTLVEGIQGSAMSSFADLPLSDRMALVHYVQSFGRFPRAPEPEAAVQAFSKLLAMPGEKVPNRIPVSKAVSRLIEEFHGPPPLRMPAPGETSPGASILRRVVADPSRVALTLAAAPTWREGADRLARIASGGAPSNGFAVATATLSPAEWKLLREELITREGRE